jgi:two-component system, NarL family, sensor histidine kinase UhpB
MTAETPAARYLFLGTGRRAAFVDRSIEMLWGLTAADLRSDPGLWLERIHPDDRRRVADALDGTSGSSWQLEYRVVHPDGTTVWVEDRGRALNSGRGRQIAGRVADVTRPRLLEDRLLFQAQLLDAVGEAVMATDHNGVITYWNPAAQWLYGWSPEEAIGQRLADMVVPRGRRQEIATPLAWIIAAAEPWSGELHLRHRGGLEVPVRMTLAPLMAADGEVVGVSAVAFDLSALRRAEARVRDSEEHQRRLIDELRRLTSHLLVVREQEQARIAREIHDELGQMLTGLKLDIGWLLRRAAVNGHELDGEQLRARLAGVAQLVDHTLDAVRHIAGQLRPPALDDLGLETAIEWLVDEFRTRTRIPCELHAALPSLPPDDARDTAAFRILQEALTNVARHAEATRVVVRVQRAGAALLLEVVDDGKGVPRAAVRAPRSLGFLGMRERAHACGGELIVRRLPRGGTRVRGRLPIARAAPAPPVAEIAAGKETS